MLMPLIEANEEEFVNYPIDQYKKGMSPEDILLSTLRSVVSDDSRGMPVKIDLVRELIHEFLKKHKPSNRATWDKVEQLFEENKPQSDIQRLDTFANKLNWLHMASKDI